MIRPIVLFIACSLAFWAVASLLIFRLWSSGAVAAFAIAFSICVIPGVATLALSTWAAKQSSDQQFNLMLGGTGVRLFAVLIAAFALYQAVPFLRQLETPSFWTFVLVSYMITLILETTISLMGRRNDVANMPSGPSQVTG